MWTVSFWKESFELAMRGGAHMVLVGWAVGEGAIDAFQLDWKLGLGYFAGGAVISILTSFVASGIGDHSTPVITQHVR